MSRPARSKITIICFPAQSRRARRSGDFAYCARLGAASPRKEPTMADDVRPASDAAMPDTMEGLRRQNSAYRSLCASLEAPMAILTAKGREYQEAVTTDRKGVVSGKRDAISVKH